ncbi:MAG: DNA-directed RNA polymerase subunit omega [Acidobacteriota bacterium]|nr:MAG: DNA-directed RNA polymerase subunit omega [Acidobacteriota bacterium]
MKIPETFDSKFRFVLVAAERAKQLQHGASPKIQIKSRKAAHIAIKETEADLVEFSVLEEDSEG